MHSLHEWICAISFLLGIVIVLLWPLDILRAFLAGMLIYFQPVLMGQRDFIYGFGSPDEQTVILVSLLVSATSFVCLITPRMSPKVQSSWVENSRFSWGIFLNGLGIVLIVSLAVRYGPTFFLHPRNESPLSGLDKESLRILSSLAFIFGIVAKQKVTLIVGTVLLVVTTLVGDRTAVAMTAGAWMLHLAGLEDSSLLSFILRRWPIFVLLFVFVIYGKLIYMLSPLIAQGQFDKARETYVRITSKTPISEPVVTFETLNKSVVRDFTIWPDELSGSAARSVPFSNLSGLSRGYSFNNLMQSSIFPGTKWESMAYNPWAEGWGASRWLGVSIVLVGFLSVMVFLVKIFHQGNTITHPVFLMAGAYFSLYSHRNTFSLSVFFVLQWLLFAAALYLIYRVLLGFFSFVTDLRCKHNLQAVQ